MNRHGSNDSMRESDRNGDRYPLYLDRNVEGSYFWSRVRANTVITDSHSDRAWSFAGSNYETRQFGTTHDNDVAPGARRPSWKESSIKEEEKNRTGKRVASKKKNTQRQKEE